MAFCSKCGTQVADEVRFCPSCGNNLAGTSNEQESGYTQTNQQSNYNQGSNWQAGGNYAGPSFMKTNDTTAHYHPQDIAENKILAILAYIGILWLVPFFAGKHSPFTKYHVKQAFLVICAEVAWAILGGILMSVIKVQVDVMWGFGYEKTPGLLVFIVWLVHVCIWAFSVLGIINAATGKAKELPFIGKFANKLTFLN